MKRLALFLRLAVIAALIGTVQINTRPAAAEVVIRYVTPDGVASGDCSSPAWAHPCALQYALSVAQVGDEIWVKAGTYRPAVDDKEAWFALKDGVAVYGGFAGTETSRADRRWAVNVTVLSGDMLGNDAGAAHWDNPTYADNSYHVVTARGVSSAAVLDGFTVRGGHAVAGGVFERNPQSGGGLSLEHSSPTLRNLIISGNTTGPAGTGGGLAINWFDSKPWLTNILFTGNQAGTAGGGMDNIEGSPVLTNVTFSGNKAGVNGGAVSTLGGAMPIRNSILWGNSAPKEPTLSIKISSVTLRNSDVQGGCPAGGPLEMCDGTDLYTDPQFIDAPGPDAIYGTPDDNLRLMTTSPLIDQGSSTVNNPPLPLTDLDGLPRVVGEAVDMGAYEEQLNQPPSSMNQQFVTTQNKPLQGWLAASDADGDPLVFLLSKAPSAGTLNLQSSGIFIYTPAPGYIGSISFEFKVSDQKSLPVGPFAAKITVQDVAKYWFYLPCASR